MIVVVGTAKQHVADDYAKRLANGMREADEIVSDGLNLLTQTKGKDSGLSSALTQIAD